MAENSKIWKGRNPKILKNEFIKNKQKNNTKNK